MGLGVQNLGLRVWGVRSGFSRACGFLCQTLLAHSALSQVFFERDLGAFSTIYKLVMPTADFPEVSIVQYCSPRPCSILLRVHLDYKYSY